ncbi:hypothetical protein HMPREF7215_2138 [Pyramidobacter piscolens W5455]|uniref:Uncharacterized protein n=1 Tax=Pyramidobacter piscolens W5455 TaxID=352165 RepID=A0ABM9ZUD9_9BACT|nr:hypothetical protein HMPREF7215_2138 [Pyramidobacter piscolens W5455]
MEKFFFAAHGKISFQLMVFFSIATILFPMNLFFVFYKLQNLTYAT